ncbi:hypothetical protein H4R26_002060 [Coemansia thaxteri]|uniref:SF3 helicase domain-containing protein n=1 Tax=Coemansia thaxteri TaxID=2663907 RepID=A0A9W8BFL3_9FUNG|nr:hypothetical protein H4R26_002060 [Coemansia thaxteri]KAJ2485767.1 hypothetical protein EV174_001522 [Coemansia sp. RSA 2320]
MADLSGIVNAERDSDDDTFATTTEASDDGNPVDEDLSVTRPVAPGDQRPKGNVPSWYSYYCKKFLTADEMDEVGIKNIELFFDPIHALVIEDVIAEKIGHEEWKATKERDAAKMKTRRFLDYSYLLNAHMLTPEKTKNMIFVEHIWIVNPTSTKTKNAIEILQYERTGHKKKGEIKKEDTDLMFNNIKSFLTSDILGDIFDTKNIIAFDDGVLDMSRFERGLRNGRPSDFVTTSIKYKIRFEPSRQMQLELSELLRYLFPDDELRDYFLLHMSSCLDSGNLDKLFVIWFGMGNNGKSVLESLVEHTFGSYCYKAPTSLFSSRRTGSSAATPETANFNKTLISFIQESDSRENMNIGVLKEMTGNDTIYTRNLYETPKTIEVRCKFILVTNKIYNLSQADEATWARIRVIPFLSKFTNDETEVDEEKNIFRMDSKYVKRVRILAPYFMQLLMETYPRYRANGLPSCRLVNEHTSSLKRLNSPVALFVEDDLIKGKENSVRFQEAYEAYRVYARNNCGMRNVTAANFEVSLSKIGIDVVEGNIIGYCLRE